jgi:isoleucyl-tRNA synthetase
MFDLPKPMSFAKREHEILHFWNENHIFEKSLALRAKNQTFTFYDGPPFATGLPHYGHLLASTIKDVVCRYRSMKGFHVPRRFGWDCHGLPIESLVEKKLSLSGAASIRQYGIAKFNEVCRENVLLYTQQWKKTVSRIARWVDMDKPYKTMDAPFMESVWWVFKALFDKGLIYKGYKVMPFSWKLGTPLSNFEAGENYQEVDDPSLFLSFVDEKEEDLHYLAWTTTPWTLVSNMALVVHPDIVYAEVAFENKRYVLAKERLEIVFKDKAIDVLRLFCGRELVGRTYRPLFNYFSHLKDQGAFRVISGEFVSTGDGTGIVHAAPAFGEDDFEVSKRHGVPLVCPITENGIFDAQVSALSGKLWSDCQKEIIMELKSSGRLFHQATIRHRYPFCYRTDTPLIYRVTETWFVSVESMRERLLANNKKITWVPEHIRDGRFGKWLEGAKDWSISRNRFWGTPIPLWQSQDGDLIAIGSRQELFELSGQKVDDLHRQFLDDIVIVRGDKTYRRIDAVFDCWFESGSMPYAQNDYPFEHKAFTQKHLPADFIAEGLDQTRGWFYTLHVLSSALFDKPAFSNVIVNGIVLAEDGNKMSKRLQNYPDPIELVEKYGADALRLYLLKSPVVRAEDLSFSEAGVDGVLKQVLLPFWNSYSFFLTYARLYKWNPKTAPALENEALSDLDRWLLSRLQTLVKDVADAMEQYRLWEAVAPLTHFIEDLTNWYIRRSRRRFWSNDSQHLADRNAAMHTLYTVLISLCKVMAPFAPFISESVYQNLKGPASGESVHLCDFPMVFESRRDLELEQTMQAIQTFASMGHGLRKEHKLRVRQPLRKAWIVDTYGQLSASILKYAPILQDELNVKSVGIKTSTEGMLKRLLKPNFKTLGPRIGRKMKALQQAISKLEGSQIAHFQKQGYLDLEVEEEAFKLGLEDMEIVYEVLPGQVAQWQQGLAISLETQLDEELILEGIAREIVNKVNTLRKELDLEITDRIDLRLASEESQQLAQVFVKYGAYIREETLALHLSMEELTQWQIECELGEISAKIFIKRFPHHA